jgi:hypothetical protein
MTLTEFLEEMEKAEFSVTLQLFSEDYMKESKWHITIERDALLLGGISAVSKGPSLQPVIDQAYALSRRIQVLSNLAEERAERNSP